MSAIEFTKTYLLINALLLIAYALFSILRRAANSSRFKARHRQLIYVAQILILLSISVPPAIHLLPKDGLPNIQWSAFRPLSEEGNFLTQKKKAIEKKQTLELKPRQVDIFRSSFT